jgi:hypothetical protein
MVEDSIMASGVMLSDSGILLNRSQELGHWEYWGTPPTGVFIPNLHSPLFYRGLVDNIVASLALDREREVVNVNVEARLVTPIDYVKEVDILLGPPIEPAPLVDLSWED